MYFACARQYQCTLDVTLISCVLSMSHDAYFIFLRPMQPKQPPQASGSSGSGAHFAHASGANADPPGSDCMICSDPATVVFHPCLHKIVCDECSARMKKCLHCKQPILRKESTGKRRGGGGGLWGAQTKHCNSQSFKSLFFSMLQTSTSLSILCQKNIAEKLLQSTFCDQTLYITNVC